jgi:hypothetical protein
MGASVWQRWWGGRRQRGASAWGALLDEEEILLVALSRQAGGVVRVLAYEQLQAPPELRTAGERDDWLVQTLRRSGARLPAFLRTMALALREGRCRHGILDVVDPLEDPEWLVAEVQLEAASVWGVGPHEIGFDFQWQPATSTSTHPSQARQIHWAACLRSELLRWQGHARDAGWRLPSVEPEHQAARRAAMCLQGEWLQHWVQSPLDWQFEGSHLREISEHDWLRLQASPLWGPLVACGAALGAMP